MLEEQKEDLSDIKSEFLAYRNAFSRTMGTVGKSLAGLKEEKSENARMLSFLKQSTEDKDKVEKDLRSGLSQKQVEIRRLSTDLAKARMVEEGWNEKLSEQQEKYSELERRLEESARSETEARRRLSISETSSSSRKEVMSLSSLVEANKVEVERLREELDLQSKSHSLRIAELQESFQAKIRELRRVHSEQMAVSRSQLEDELREKVATEAATSASSLAADNAALTKEIGALKSKVEALSGQASDLEKKLDASKTQEGETRKKVYMAEKQNRSLRAEVDDLKTKAGAAIESGKLAKENKALAEEVDRLKSDLEAKTKALAEKNETKEDLSMVDIMEQQLVKLSTLLSTKEEEIEALKLTVEKECEERADLVAELSRYTRISRKNL